MSKFFKAISKTDPADVVEFDLGSIFTINDHVTGDGKAKICIEQNSFCDKQNIVTTEGDFTDWLKNYILYHLEQGEYVLHGGGDD